MNTKLIRDYTEQVFNDHNGTAALGFVSPDARWRTRDVRRRVAHRGASPQGEQVAAVSVDGQQLLDEFVARRAGLRGFVEVDDCRFLPLMSSSRSSTRASGALWPATTIRGASAATLSTLAIQWHLTAHAA
ncbi:MAG: hypothetical protein QOI08_2569 [Actinomycetota bacterium]|nr:hypothetical protein [Actinomycetota bacterium]